MSLFMNEPEIDQAVARYDPNTVIGKAARILSLYRDEVNRKSDGWPYWGHKCASKLMALVYNADARVRSGLEHDATEAELRRACGPIKSFCTKRGLTFPVGIL
jgi:hypothetical protein